jgi:hypothetical protein
LVNRLRKATRNSQEPVSKEMAMELLKKTKKRKAIIPEENFNLDVP